MLFYSTLHKLKFFQFVTFERHLLPVMLLHNTNAIPNV